MVISQLEGAIPDLTQIISPQIEEGAEIVGFDVLKNKEIKLIRQKLMRQN